MKHLKAHFMTGLVILLPLAITLALVFFIVNLLTQPFVGFFENFLVDIPWVQRHTTLVHFILQIFFIIFLFFFIVLLGVMARAIVFKSFLKLNDYIIHRIPFIKTVYKACQQVIRAILGTSSRSFKQVVMVPFPKENSFAIGFITGEAPQICQQTTNETLITVFVPTTPNPTSGFLMLYRKEEIIYTDMKIEDALKYVISCGVISSDEIH